jgi:acetyl esterase/lipase
MPIKSLALGLALALAACSVTTPPEPAKPPAPVKLLVWPDLLTRERPEPTETLRYNRGATHVVDLWLPPGGGPHPTVLMVHGGCWQTEIADRRIMNWIANDLRKRGIAVWNIDYRGVDKEGGGYPGTFNDVTEAIGMLQEIAPKRRLDTSRLVAVGHSAGGHLALWLAGQHRISPGSRVRHRVPLLPIRTVISLGGLPDLEEAARPPGSGCGTEVIAKLTNGSFGDTSVPRLAPLGVEQVLINGLQDRIIPTAYADSYARKMRAAGDRVKVRMIDNTGHVELIAPESAAWAATVEEIEKALGIRRK